MYQLLAMAERMQVEWDHPARPQRPQQAHRAGLPGSDGQYASYDDQRLCGVPADPRGE